MKPLNTGAFPEQLRLDSTLGRRASSNAAPPWYISGDLNRRVLTLIAC